MLTRIPKYFANPVTKRLFCLPAMPARNQSPQKLDQTNSWPSSGRRKSFMWPALPVKCVLNHFLISRRFYTKMTCCARLALKEYHNIRVRVRLDFFSKCKKENYKSVEETKSPSKEYMEIFDFAFLVSAVEESCWTIQAPALSKERLAPTEIDSNMGKSCVCA